MRLLGILMRLIGFAGFLFAAGPLRADTIEGYRHTGWTTEKGAPAPAGSLTQSPNGYLWMASGNDVFRFDGITFEKLPALRDPQLGDLTPITVHASPSGDVWIGYSPGAVAVYRHGILRDLHMPDAPGFVTRIDDDGSGGIWVAVDRARNGLRHFSSGRWTTAGEAQGVPASQTLQVLVGRDGTTWVVQSDALLMRRRGSVRFEVTPATVAGSAGIAQGPDGRLWIADLAGVRPLPDYVHGATDHAVGSSPKNGGLRRLVFDRAGNLWITDLMNGLTRIDAKQLDDPAGRAHPETYRAEDGLTGNRASSPLVDREGNIWVGTENGLDRMRTAVVRRQPGLAAGSAAYAGASDSQGIIYLLDDVGIHVVLPGQPARLVSPIAGDVSIPCRRADGTVSVSVPGIIYQLRPDRLIASPGRADVPGPCAEDGHGRLWVLSYATNLSWLDQSGWHAFKGPVDTAKAMDLMPGQAGEVLANLGKRSLLRLDPARPTLISAAKLGVGPISSANRGDRGLLVSGSRGLARLRGNDVQVLPGDRYPWLARLKALIATPRGDTWMLSPAGIIRVATSDLDRAFDHPDHGLPYQLFDAADGLTGHMQKNGIVGSQIFEGADHAIRFLTSAGVMMIDPATLTRNMLLPPVVVSSVTSGGTKYLDPTEIKLRPGTSSIAIAYTAPSLSVPERVRFRYRLEGIDDGWVDPGSRREAVYGNLGPGMYRFRVIAANNDGVWNMTGATVHFDVPPTFVQSIWFELLCAIGVIAVLWLAYSTRLRQVTANLNAAMGVRLAERERIARELHDTLLQTFQGLVLQFQAAANRVPAEGPARQAIEQALKRADVALAEGRDRVRELRVDGTDGDLARGWTAIAAELGADRPIRFELTVEGRPRTLHPLVQEELQRLGEEALRNAFHHAQASAIEVLLTYRVDRLRFDIRDDGIGLPEDVAATGKRSGHYGLTGMRERAQRIGGKLTIVSRQGVGTEILFSMAGPAAYAGGTGRLWLTTLFGGKRNLR